jgi:hypothetical protein
MKNNDHYLKNITILQFAGVLQSSKLEYEPIYHSIVFNQNGQLNLRNITTRFDHFKSGDSHCPGRFFLKQISQTHDDVFQLGPFF